MGRSASSKLQEAQDLRRMSRNLRKADPESARDLLELSRRKVRQAVKQMKTRPKRKRASSGNTAFR